MQTVAQRREGIAQLVGQGREELILAPIHDAQSLAALLERFVELRKRLRVRAGFAVAFPKCCLCVAAVVHVAQDRRDEAARAVLPARSRDFKVAQRAVLAPEEHLRRLGGRGTRVRQPRDFGPGVFAFEEHYDRLAE